jgi:hypothetical protein
MVEYEWEVRRVPRAPEVRGPGGTRLRKGPAAEYAALEFPGESVAWVVQRAPEVPSRPLAAEGSPPSPRAQRAADRSRRT